MASTSRYRSDRAKNLVGFRIGEVDYAVEIARVAEIMNPLPIVAIPNAPPSVIGVVDHRAEVIPVLDLRRRLGLPPVAPTRRTKWIVVRIGARAIGLVVDRVTDVFGANPSEQRDLPELGQMSGSRGVAAVYMHHDLLVFVLDVDRVAAVTEDLDVDLVRSAMTAEEAR